MSMQQALTGDFRARVKPTSDPQSQAPQVLDRVRAKSLDDDTGAVIYNCDPQANHRAIVRVNELCRLRVLRGTREEAIEAVWRELDQGNQNLSERAASNRSLAGSRARKDRSWRTSPQLADRRQDH
jgi:hypothetical protein